MNLGHSSGVGPLYASCTEYLAVMCCSPMVDIWIGLHRGLEYDGTRTRWDWPPVFQPCGNGTLQDFVSSPMCPWEETDHAACHLGMLEPLFAQVGRSTCHNVRKPMGAFTDFILLLSRCNPQRTRRKKNTTGLGHMLGQSLVFSNCAMESMKLDFAVNSFTEYIKELSIVKIVPRYSQ